MSGQDEKVKPDDTIKYRPTFTEKSHYKFTKLIQNVGSEAVTIGASQQISTFEIPSVCMNLARSYLNFSATIAAQDIGFFSHCFRDVISASRWELYLRDGTYLADVSSFAQMVRTNGQRNKHIEDFHSSDFDVLSRTAVNDLNIRRINSSADNTAEVMSFRIAGKEIYDTIMSLDKNLYFGGQVIMLRITWREAPAWGYRSDNADPALGTTTALQGNVEITDLSYMLSQEANPVIATALIQKVTQGTGIQTIVPYSFVYRTSLQNSTSHAISVRLSAGHGLALERVYTRFGTDDETKENRYNAELTTADFTSWYALLNSRRMSEFDILAGGTSDYHWMREREHGGKVVGLSILNDTGDYAWTNDWCGGRTQCAIKGEAGGLSLTEGEVKYDLYVKCNGAKSKTYYTIVVCQRMLTINPMGTHLQ